jgi:hypothetical protein
MELASLLAHRWVYETEIHRIITEKKHCGIMNFKLQAFCSG